MKPYRRLCVCLTTLGLLASAAASFAQQVVFDPGNYAQAIKQVTAWQAQYQQMVTQIEQMKGTLSQAQAQYAALTGSRNLGDLANNPLLKNVVPADVAEVLKTVNTGGFNNLTQDAKLVRQLNLIYNCEDRTGADKTACEAALNGTAQAQAYDQWVLALLSQRADQITTLQGQIDSAQDPKAIADLQARILVAQAEVQNDANRIATMNAMAAAQRDAAQQALKERTLKRLSASAPATADTFQFQMPNQ